MDDDFDASLITREGMDALLRFLPYFQSKRARFGTAPQIVGGSISCSCLTKQASDFYEACYTHHFVQPFDWHAWYAAHRQLVVDGEGIEELTLEEIGKLITTHIRGDRFSDGHLLHVMRSGQMGRLLERLMRLRESTP